MPYTVICYIEIAFDLNHTKRNCGHLSYICMHDLVNLPYLGKFRREEVTKFWLVDKNFPRRIFLPDQYFYSTNTVNKSKFPGESDGISLLPPPREYSIQRPNFKVGVNLRGH